MATHPNMGVHHGGIMRYYRTIDREDRDGMKREDRRGGKRKTEYSRKRKGGKRKTDGGRRKTYRKKRGY